MLGSHSQGGQQGFLGSHFQGGSNNKPGLLGSHLQGGGLLGSHTQGGGLLGSLFNKPQGGLINNIPSIPLVGNGISQSQSQTQAGNDLRWIIQHQNVVNTRMAKVKKSFQAPKYVTLEISASFLGTILTHILMNFYELLLWSENWTNETPIDFF